MAESIPNPKVCRFCGKLYRSRSGLNDHERRHTKKAPFFCCCGKYFYSKTNLLCHRCNVHATPKKKQTCKVCLNTFGTRAELKLHTDRVHKDNAFSCDMCGKTIVIEATLKDHMDSHSGEKRYVCQCGKTYRYNSNLSRHQQKCSAKRQS